jgi:hypothetical protein
MNQPSQPGYPPPHAGYPPPPPPRQGRPWWVWLLGGCAGCAVLVIGAVIFLTISTVNTVKDLAKDVGPVNAASVQQSLGSEIPVYPGAKLGTVETQSVLTTFRFMEKMTGKKPGAIFGGAGMYTTPDSQEKVLKHYDSAMEKGGWKKIGNQKTSFNSQSHFQKGEEILIVQVQNAPEGGTHLTLMRGGPGLVEMNRQSGSSPAPAPSR